MRWPAKHVLPSQRDAADVRDIKPTQRVEDGRFARAVGTDETGDLSGARREAHVGDRPHTAEGQREALDLQHSTMCPLSQPGQDIDAIGRPGMMGWTTTETVAYRTRHTSWSQPEDSQKERTEEEQAVFCQAG